MNPEDVLCVPPDVVRAAPSARHHCREVALANRRGGCVSGLREIDQRPMYDGRLLHDLAVH